MTLLEVTDATDRPTPAVDLFQGITAHHGSSAVHVAARLELADRLADGPKGFEELAEATKTNAFALRRLLRLLVSCGVFAEPEPGVYALTEIGYHLRTDVTDSMHSFALMMANPRNQQRWGELTECVRTGASRVPEEHKGDPFQQMPPHILKLLGKTMTFFVGHTAGAIVDGYDFSQFRTLVELGGGEGILLSAILTANPDLRGITLDLPYMAENAQKRVAGSAVADRCTVVGGDFFESVPQGDAYLLNNVIHDWDDEASVKILANCAAELAPGGKVIIVETQYPERFDDSIAAKIAGRSDVNMMVNANARERSAADFERLVSASGFELNRVIEIRPAWTGVRSSMIVEAVRR
ncbi:methyltransferase [Amycolatopsis sp. cg5]|uniref:methyltransferase n=1 Tax=Amycolatopsis sp. cg5 TaxID=3238802 RepID=UPI003524B694